MGPFLDWRSVGDRPRMRGWRDPSSSLVSLWRCRPTVPRFPSERIWRRRRGRTLPSLWLSLSSVRESSSPAVLSRRRRSAFVPASALISIVDPVDVPVLAISISISVSLSVSSVVSIARVTDVPRISNVPRVADVPRWRRGVVAFVPTIDRPLIASRRTSWLDRHRRGRAERSRRGRRRRDLLRRLGRLHLHSILILVDREELVQLGISSDRLGCAESDLEPCRSGGGTKRDGGHRWRRWWRRWLAVRDHHLRLLFDDHRDVLVRRLGREVLLVLRPLRTSLSRRHRGTRWTKDVG